MKNNNVRLILEDGKVFHGNAFAKSGDKYAELVFNTGMTGYQEILTDPSYQGQAVIMTYPLIGSYGINDEDFESRKIFLDALLVKEYIDFPSNWRSKRTLKEYLEKYNVLGVEGLDTRAITKYIREGGTCKAALTTMDGDPEIFISRLQHTNIISGFNTSKFASCESSFVFNAGSHNPYKVAVIDCGIKKNILRLLASKGCECHVFSGSSHMDRILAENFDGLFISNGPGDPEPIHEVTVIIQQLLGKIPIFGICLGHQLLGLALGARTYKLRFGHHGVNHPIKNLHTGRIEITSQNHNYALDPKTLSDQIEVTHINLNDQTVAGIKHKTLPAFSVQYHPEAAPGPLDSHYLFDNFINLMKEEKKKRRRVVSQGASLTSSPNYSSKGQGKKRLNLFIRQSFTEAGEEESLIIKQVIREIQSLDGKYASFHYLTGTEAYHKNNFQAAFERDYHQAFTPENFRNKRLELLRQADACIIIRTGLSESTAFEIAANIFDSHSAPVFFAIWKNAPIKTTLLRNLENLLMVRYCEFTNPEELRPALSEFFTEVTENKKTKQEPKSFYIPSRNLEMTI